MFDSLPFPRFSGGFTAGRFFLAAPILPTWRETDKKRQIVYIVGIFL
ncbi:hypothetical protein B4135_1280 [Caldibacillus debilis]|uniref:Uncharacterized protein n=1 Tax=Caldibacillus debilis TaxID=301148 RepID=A0A150MD71_9BACI|nr:hypothetical protein B4135_1280 [Caldibacillus debilis]